MIRVLVVQAKNISSVAEKYRDRKGDKKPAVCRLLFWEIYMKTVDVAVGIIQRQDQVFISKRQHNLHQGGLWEFPGGKVEVGETPAQALQRELYEEVGIQVLHSEGVMLVEHDYGDKRVRLHIMSTTEFTGEPFGKESQQCQWVNISELEDYQFPEANKTIVEYILSQS